MTSVEKSCSAPTATERLSGKAQVGERTLLIEITTSSESFTMILEKLDKKFGVDKASLLPVSFWEFFDFVWYRSTPIGWLVIKLHSHLEGVIR